MGKVTTNNGSKTLAATQSNIISEAKYGGGRRRVLSITNNEAAGGSAAYLAVGSEARANSGIVLAPGASFTWAQESGYLPPQDQVNAYSAGAIILTIYEEVELV